MPNSLYVINAKAKGASYFGAEVFAHFGFPHAQGIADLAAVTVAALAPHGWDISVCDEHLSPIDFDHPAAYIGITGKVTQAIRMLEIAAEFQRRGKTILMGGPCVSLSPELFRGACDILVTGELETIAAELFADLEHSRWKPEYIGGRAELAMTPMPRWDLYPTERALSGCVQTSRGCPFECEFCDVIQYLGRRQRIKPIPQILAETRCPLSVWLPHSISGQRQLYRLSPPGKGNPGCAQRLEPQSASRAPRLQYPGFHRRCP